MVIILYKCKNCGAQHKYQSEKDSGPIYPRTKCPTCKKRTYVIPHWDQSIPRSHDKMGSKNKRSPEPHGTAKTQRDSLIGQEQNFTDLNNRQKNTKSTCGTAPKKCGTDTTPKNEGPQKKSIPSEKNEIPKSEKSAPSTAPAWRDHFFRWKVKLSAPIPQNIHWDNIRPMGHKNKPSWFIKSIKFKNVGIEAPVGVADPWLILNLDEDVYGKIPDLTKTKTMPLVIDILNFLESMGIKTDISTLQHVQSQHTASKLRPEEVAKFAEWEINEHTTAKNELGTLGTDFSEGVPELEVQDAYKFKDGGYGLTQAIVDAPGNLVKLFNIVSKLGETSANIVAASANNIATLTALLQQNIAQVKTQVQPPTAEKPSDKKEDTGKKPDMFS